MADKQLPPLPPVLLSATTFFVLLEAPDVLNNIWLYLKAFFHGSQYLVVTTSVSIKQNKDVLQYPGILLRDRKLRQLLVS